MSISQNKSVVMRYFNFHIVIDIFFFERSLTHLAGIFDNHFTSLDISQAK